MSEQKPIRVMIVDDHSMMRTRMGFCSDMTFSRPTGKECWFDWIHVWTVRDGKIAKFKIVLDSAPVMLAFASDD